MKTEFSLFDLLVACAVGVLAGALLILGPGRSGHTHGAATAEGYSDQIASLVRGQTTVEPLPGSPESVAAEFSRALARGDSAMVRDLLLEGVSVYESGWPEHGVAEYAGEHLEADIEFLRQAEVQTLRRRGLTDGNLAVVETESRIRAKEGGKGIDLLSLETMVLAQQPSGWRIRGIHWSSHRIRSSAVPEIIPDRLRQ